ncbi:hypothetical protein CSV86_016685 [Pseudomonas putida CSV86]|uniref:Uncharacterized protein n=1 Tax=Pseudomonas bharatica CSV86 TaxID=1005395 RepID=L1M6W5_9PSED|nr:hypothetical protein [Pseudomonas bharatica]NNJ16725.1 hypothetical protein [Pseudomonas bharatica CSV86]
MTSSNHPLLKFLATLPQFHSQLLHSVVIDMRSGAVVSKYDGGDEPKHRHSLLIRWPAQTFAGQIIIDGEKYARLQVMEAVDLGANEGGLSQALVEALA